jgi:CelD/BcsL family acetyltransferase involved in cellulose biosynthesis
VTQPALREAARDAGSLVLSGIGDETLHAARAAGWLDLHQSRFAPSVGLAALGGAYLDTLSANTRAQIRRSQRLYGPELRLSRAESLEQALAYFNELAALHQAAWIGRGKPGAFGAARMRQFHSALIARAWPRGQADLLRIAAGPRPIGLLYNFIRDGKVLSYQSGFAPTGDAREKPGLVCHTLAIEYYAAAGHRCYDLLAGADRYKLSLASGGEMLHWATLHRPRSLSGAASLLKAALRQLKPASSG